MNKLGLILLTVVLAACEGPQVTQSFRDKEEGHQFAYISNNNGPNSGSNGFTRGFLQVVNTDTLVRTMPDGIGVGSNSDGVAVHPNGEFVFVANTAGGAAGLGTISVISTLSNTVVSTLGRETLQSESSLVFNNPKRLVVSPDGETLFVADENDNAQKRIRSFRLNTINYSNAYTMTLDFTGSDLQFTPDGSHLISVGSYGLSILTLDPMDPALITAELSFSFPLDLLHAYNPDSPNDFSIIDIRGMDIDENTGWLYVANAAGWDVLAVNYVALLAGSFDVYNTNHFKTAVIRPSDELAPGPYDVVVDQTDSLLYVSVTMEACANATCGGTKPSGFIKVFDLNGFVPFTVQDTIQLATISVATPTFTPSTHPLAIDISAGDGYIYVVKNEYGLDTSHYLSRITKELSIGDVAITGFSESSLAVPVGSPVTHVGPFMGPTCKLCPEGENLDADRASVRASLSPLSLFVFLFALVINIVARQRRQYNKRN